MVLGTRAQDVYERIFLADCHNSLYLNDSKSQTFPPNAHCNRSYGHDCRCDSKANYHPSYCFPKPEWFQFGSGFLGKSSLQLAVNSQLIPKKIFSKVLISVPELGQAWFRSSFEPGSGSRNHARFRFGFY